MPIWQYLIHALHCDGLRPITENRVAEMRIDLPLSVADFADRAGVSRDTIYRTERGEGIALDSARSIVVAGFGLPWEERERVYPKGFRS